MFSTKGRILVDLCSERHNVALSNHKQVSFHVSCAVHLVVGETPTHRGLTHKQSSSTSPPLVALKKIKNNRRDAATISAASSSISPALLPIISVIHCRYVSGVSFSWNLLKLYSTSSPSSLIVNSDEPRTTTAAIRHFD